MLGEHVAIWGGLPSVIFEPAWPASQFDEYVRGIVEEVKANCNFVMGMGDNVPPGAAIERVHVVARIVEDERPNHSASPQTTAARRARIEGARWN